MLLSAVVIDELHQEFFIEILSKDNKTTIRLYPLTDPKKTDGVKFALGLVADFIKKNQNGLSISKTNISEFIPN